MAAVIFGCMLANAHGDTPAPAPKSKTDTFPDLVGALKAIPGCLGVEVAKADSGKHVIFAWFEDKKAALAWFNSETHQQVMKQFFPNGFSGRKPLVDVAENSGPIMAVASITYDKANKDNPYPFKQIAIELYQPLNGGLSIGGRFAPDKMKVPPRKNDAKP
jgi:hypothetical protein